MEKSALLQEVTSAAAQKSVTKDELVAAYNAGAPQGDGALRHLNLSRVLYYIGGAIIVIGISVLISQNWDALSVPLRVIVTLGSAVAAYIMGVLFSRYDNFDDIGQAFYFISGLVAPIGLGVLVDSMGIQVGTTSVTLSLALVLFLVYLASFFLLKRRIVFMIFVIIFGTAVFHNLISLMIGGNPIADTAKLLEYRALAAGVAYLFLGYYFAKGSLSPLTGSLYAFGSIAFLGAAMALGGWSPDQNAFWELFYPVLVFGLIYTSVFVKSRALLIFGALFLIGYILKLTGEYFTSGLGWPLALVLAGLAVMLVGYYTVRINKKYLKKIS
jgi:hypothetical protein